MYNSEHIEGENIQNNTTIIFLNKQNTTHIFLSVAVSIYSFYFHLIFVKNPINYFF